MTAAVRLGTRKSPLALAQSRLVADSLTAVSGRPVELVSVTTQGDVSRESLSTLGGTGVFVSALRDALTRGDVDIAVHSLKDLPTAPSPGLELVAIPARADARDVLVGRDGLTLTTLPDGASVGTGSPRRAAQLRAIRPDLRIVDIRGNLDTRLGLVAAGHPASGDVVDAIVLAYAGLARLGRLDAVTQIIEPSVMLPAPGQGALAVEACTSALDPDLHASLRSLDDGATRAAITAERAVLSALEAGCSAPVGALAVVDEPGFHEPELALEALVAAIDGSSVTRLSITAPLVDADHAGRQLAARLLGAGIVVS